MEFQVDLDTTATMVKMETAREAIAAIKKINPDALLLDGFHEALVGYRVNPGPTVAVYCQNAVVGILVRGGLAPPEAEEHFEFNIEPQYGENAPFFGFFEE